MGMMKVPHDEELHGASEAVIWVVQGQTRYGWIDEDCYRCRDGKVLGGPWPTVDEAKRRVRNMRRSLRRAYAPVPTWRVVKRVITNEEVWQ